MDADRRGSTRIPEHFKFRRGGRGGGCFTEDHEGNEERAEDWRLRFFDRINWIYRICTVQLTAGYLTTEGTKDAEGGCGLLGGFLQRYVDCDIAVGWNQEPRVLIETRAGGTKHDEASTPRRRRDLVGITASGGLNLD